MVIVGVPCQISASCKCCKCWCLRIFMDNAWIFSNWPYLWYPAKMILGIPWLTGGWFWILTFHYPHWLFSTIPNCYFSLSPMVIVHYSQFFTIPKMYFTICFEYVSKSFGYKSSQMTTWLVQRGASCLSHRCFCWAKERQTVTVFSESKVDRLVMLFFPCDWWLMVHLSHVRVRYQDHMIAVPAPSDCVWVAEHASTDAPNKWNAGN